jgi:hypothetical protein
MPLEEEMIRETSVEAYDEIKENGLLSERRFEVYDFIARNGPCSINKLLQDKAWIGRNTGSLTGRISELERMGLIVPWGKETAPTGHRVILWEITKNLPSKLVVLETKTQTINRLQKEVVELRSELISFRCRQSEQNEFFP